MSKERGELIVEAVDRERKRAATKALDISLNELADMYRSTEKELNIRPEFQRMFRWSKEKQSQFIESLILEMPIPPIFVIETEVGKWELIDGLQRVSSYLHYRGYLDAPECEPPINRGDKLLLEGCDIITELNKLGFEDLPLAMQIRLKRSYLRVEVVRKETNQKFRYYMFKRLNTGGETLEEQEIRNCTIRLLGDRFNNFLLKLSKNADFQICIGSLSQVRRRQMYDVELVLRFFAFKNDLDNFKHDVAPFMTHYMERVTLESDSLEEKSEGGSSFDYDAERHLFEKTFRLLASTLGEDTCQRWAADKFVGGFSVQQFEAFSIGAARVVDRIQGTDPMRIKASLNEVKKDADFVQQAKGGGKNSPGPYRVKIQTVQRALEALL